MTQTLAQLRALIRRDTKTIADATTRRTERVKLAREMGASAVELAADMGVTPGRVSQVAPKPKKKTTTAVAVPADAPAPRRPLTGDDLPPAFRPGVTGRIKHTLSDLKTDRWAKDQPERPTIFVDLVSGEWCSPARKTGRIIWEDGSAAELLTQLPDGVARVYLVGPNRPGVTPDSRAEFGSEADAVRMWFLTDVPGWEVQPGGHYLADEDAPIGRWKRGDQAVEVMRASTWFGEGRYSVADAAHAWYVLRGQMSTAFGKGAILLSTPASTGRDMWRRTIGKSRDGSQKSYPVLSDELRALIHATSGQGRREIVPGDGAPILEFVQYDMRFAYAALAWGMPVGAPEMWGPKELRRLDDDDRKALLKRRGRWLVTATVPTSWDRVGLLPAPAAGEAWCYPAEPGTTFTTWASGAELELADRWKWRFEMHEGFVFAEGKPLETWRTKLTTLYAAAESGEIAAPLAVRQLVRAALRNMVLMSIGAFAARTHMISRAMPITAENTAKLPDRPIRTVGDMYLWEEEGQRSEWSRRLDHPEWAAEIWARCRARLLEAPTGNPLVKAGALHVPPGTVLGMRTDALYLSVDPEWPDDGKPGRYRLKGKVLGQMTRPVTDAAMDAAKTEASRHV